MTIDTEAIGEYHLDGNQNEWILWRQAEKTKGTTRRESDNVSFQATFKALSDPTRRAILDLLKDGAKTAGEIGAHFDMTGATVSHHLSVLKEAGLVSDDRRGKFIYYELNLSVLDEITGWVAGLKGENRYEK